MKKLIHISFFFLLFLHTSAYADPFSWEGEDLTIFTGTLSNINHISNVKYKVGHRYGGWGHIEFAIQISWFEANGKQRTQIIDQGMTELSPKIIKFDNVGQVLIVEFNQYINSGALDIHQHPIFYKYNVQSKSFEQFKNSGTK